MRGLENLSCESCNKNSTALSAEEIATLMSQLNGWHIVDEIEDKTEAELNVTGKRHTKKLERIFPTKNFKQSMALSQKIADLAETVNHHPLIIVEYFSVTVQWWTHVIDGLHKNDFIMAHETSKLIPLD